MAAYTADVELPKTILKLLQKTKNCSTITYRAIHVSHTFMIDISQKEHLQITD